MTWLLDGMRGQAAALRAKLCCALESFLNVAIVPV